MHYFIHTYGCQMNVHESEKISGILEQRGYTATEDEKFADVLVYNTCCIREGAETKALGNIGQAKHLKKSNKNLIVIVAGCMTQRKDVAEKLKSKYPYVDIIVGTYNIDLLGQYLDEFLERRKRKLYVLDEPVPINEEDYAFRTSGLNAWVNITYGCNNFCTYCIVPYVRGRERSRNLNAIIDECKKLIDQGYKEITLLGQNVNSYGNDIDDKNTTFANLLEKLSLVDGDFRIKFMTSHPKDLSEDVVKVISQSPKIAKFIHLPMQSGSNNVLKLMNRKYTAEKYLNTIDMIRKYIPNCGLSSDFMVGFPQETEDDFQKTLDIVRRVRYNNLYMFIYSRRSGTVADQMEGQIDDKIKTDRITRLIELQRSIGVELAHDEVGKNLRALVCKEQDDMVTATSDCGKLIELPSSCGSYHGKFVQIHVDSNHASKLKGHIIF